MIHLLTNRLIANIDSIYMIQYVRIAANSHRNLHCDIITTTDYDITTKIILIVREDIFVHTYS